MSACLEPFRSVIRPMVFKDLEAVVAIEEASYPFPWTGGIFADCLRVGYSCWAVESGGRLIGYSVMSFGAREAHLLNLCIANDHQFRGAGRDLLDWVIDQARGAACEIIFLEVRPSNERAIRIYDKRGFSQIGVRPNYYPATGGREDAIIMAMQLDTAEQS